jgi:hypothetical protein
LVPRQDVQIADHNMFGSAKKIPGIDAQLFHGKLMHLGKNGYPFGNSTHARMQKIKTLLKAKIIFPEFLHAGGFYTIFTD